MSDPWKDAWEHLKKQIDSDIETCETWESLYADYTGRIREARKLREFMSDKEQEMVEDGLIEGSDSDAAD